MGAGIHAPLRDIDIAGEPDLLVVVNGLERPLIQFDLLVGESSVETRDTENPQSILSESFVGISDDSDSSVSDIFKGLSVEEVDDLTSLTLLRRYLIEQSVNSKITPPGISSRTSPTNTFGPTPVSSPQVFSEGSNLIIFAVEMSYPHPERLPLWEVPHPGPVEHRSHLLRLGIGGYIIILGLFTHEEVTDCAADDVEQVPFTPKDAAEV